MLSKYDKQNRKVLRALVMAGTRLMPFTPVVMEACFNAANDIYAGTIAKNAKFKKIYEPWKKFRAEEVCCDSAS